MDLHSDRRVATERLRGQLDPESFGSFRSTLDLLNGLDPMTAGLSFQPRVRESITLALSVRDRGFNVFATGENGLRKSQSILAVLEDEAHHRSPSHDWCYVFNFRDPERPKAIRLNAGDGRVFAEKMDNFIEDLKDEIPRALESEEYRQRRQKVADELHRRRHEIIEQVREEGKRRGFSVDIGPGGLVIAPIHEEGKPLSAKDFERLSDDEKDAYEQNSRELRSDIERRMRSIQTTEREGRDRVDNLDKETVFLVAGQALEDLRIQYRNNIGILEYLSQVQDDISCRMNELRAAEEALEAPIFLAAMQGRNAPYERYRVNVLVDRSQETGAPVVFEPFPTYVNLIGRIERKVEFGNLVTDFTLLRSGSLQRANGGFLVMFVDDLLRQPGAWDCLKRCIKAGEILMEDLPTMLGLSVAQVLRPEPIPLDIRVVLIGSSSIYQLLYSLDPEFRKLFQVRADFDDCMDRDGNHKSFACALARLARDEGAAPLTQRGVLRMAGYAQRVAENQSKFTTRFSILARLMHEADKIRREKGAKFIDYEHVKTAQEAEQYRNSLPMERLQELIRRKVLMVRTEGETVGQVNGLALSCFGDTTFGRPVRISAVVNPGEGEVADIERRCELGGKAHSKAMMILSGYLASRYASDLPLSVAAQITIEQSYSEIEGDSASLAETIALLSAIGRFHIRQEIAVTGSVSHMGDVQPVGGISDKIEGYFDICNATGFNGRQGVLMPDANLDHLQLRDDVVDAVAAGHFRVWSVSHVDEALEILSGLPAGKPNAAGIFPESSANGKVQSRLTHFAWLIRRFRPTKSKGGFDGKSTIARNDQRLPIPEPELPPNY